METKRCAGCHKDKLLDDFYDKGRRKRSRCKQCFKNHYEKYKNTGRNCRLAKAFGITLETYNEMLSDQSNVCWICKEPETRMLNGKICNLAVDHDHITGKVRGLLCNRCNMGLARFKDNPNLLLAAAAYLLAEWDFEEVHIGTEEESPTIQRNEERLGN